MKRILMLIGIWMLVSCSTTGHQPPPDLVQICERRAMHYDCYYVTREDLERAMRETQGQK